MEECRATCASCLCTRVAGHGGPHLCPCEGSWVGEEGQPGWEVVSLPTRFVGPVKEKGDAS